MKKKLIISAIVIVIILIIVPIIAYFSLENKDLRKWTSDRIQSSTGTAVSMENYELGFPAKILVHKLKLKTPDGIEISADEVLVHPSILKLVTGNLYLKSVSITGADISIPLNNKKEATPVKKVNVNKNGTICPPCKPAPLPLGKLEIRDATFHLTRGSTKTTISKIQVSFNPGAGFQLAMFPGDSENELKIAGTLDNKNALKTLKGSLKISRIQPLLKLLPKGDVPIEKLTGTANFSAEKTGNTLTFHGTFDFPTLNVTLDNKKLSYPLKGKINGSTAMDGSFVKLAPSTLTVRDSTFNLSGKLMPNPSLSFSGDKLGLQQLTKLIPPSQSPFPEGTRFQGKVELSGSGTANGVSANLLLKNDKIIISGMDPLELAGKLHLTEKQIQIVGLLLTSPETDLTINGTIDQYLSDHGTSNLKIRGKMLNLAPKTENSDKKEATSGKKGVKIEKNEKNKPIPVSYPDFEGMTHTVNCTIGAIMLPGLTLSNMEAALVAGDKGTFLKKCSGVTLDGSFTITGKLLPEGKGIKFSGNGQAKKLKLTGILSGKLPVEGGRLSTTFNMSGSGKDSEAIKQAANGTVKFNISDATLRDTPALEKVEELTGMKFIGKKMDHFDGEAKIRNGKAEIKNTRMSAAGIRADFSGTVSLDGKLDMKVPVQLSGEAGKKLPAKLRILESGGKVTLPLEIKGAVQKPKVKLDMKGAKKAVKKKLKKKLLNRLFGN
ncbi:MAG: AsmA family protein [Acidobacteria bacterium]|nr:AsmA family protein [Acidobacteriota bacterium]